MIARCHITLPMECTLPSFSMGQRCCGEWGELVPQILGANLVDVWQLKAKSWVMQSNQCKDTTGINKSRIVQHYLDFFECVKT